MALTKQFQPILCSDRTVTITVGGTISTGVDLMGTSLVGLVIPANFDGTVISYNGSIDGITYFPIYDNSAARLTTTVTAATLSGVSVDNTKFLAWRFIQLVATTTQTTTDTVITLLNQAME